MPTTLTRVWHSYLRYYQGAYHRIIISLVLAIGQSFFYLPLLILVRKAFDHITHQRDPAVLLHTGVGIALLYILSNGTLLYIRGSMLIASKLAIKRFRAALLDKLYSFPRRFYDHADRGTLHAQIVQGTEVIDVMTNRVASNVLPAICISILITLVLASINHMLFLLLLGMMPVLFFTDTLLRSRLKVVINQNRQALDALSSGILRMVQVMDLTRLQTASQQELKRQQTTLEQLYIIGQRFWLATAYTLSTNTIATLAGVVILVAGGYAIAAGTLTVGELVAFYAALALLKTHLSTITSNIQEILEGNKALTTLIGFMQRTEQEPYTGTGTFTIRGAITFERVTFGYDDHAPVVHHVDLHIQAGERVALVGPNGSGKSTLVHLITGCYRPQRGRLLIDERLFDAYDMENYRRQLGVVSQIPVMLPGTIYENITYGTPDACEQQVIKAARLATVDAFISRLPQGYQTVVGEGGVLLSGGQCQRIAIARALLRRPAVLILDEPTNHLDAESVRTLLRNLRKMDYIPTIVLISHDMSVVQDMEYVYTLEQGRVIASRRGVDVATLPHPQAPS